MSYVSFEPLDVSVEWLLECTMYWQNGILNCICNAYLIWSIPFDGYLSIVGILLLNISQVKTIILVGALIFQMACIIVALSLVNSPIEGLYSIDFILLCTCTSTVRSWYCELPVWFLPYFREYHLKIICYNKSADPVLVSNLLGIPFVLGTSVMLCTLLSIDYVYINVGNNFFFLHTDFVPIWISSKFQL